jgi:hypothetical protein
MHAGCRVICCLLVEPGVDPLYVVSPLEQARKDRRREMKAASGRSKRKRKRKSAEEKEETKKKNKESLAKSAFQQVTTRNRSKVGEKPKEMKGKTSKGQRI